LDFFSSDINASVFVFELTKMMVQYYLEKIKLVFRIKSWYLSIDNSCFTGWEIKFSPIVRVSDKAGYV
jgi:hypothetical protein